MGIISSQDWSDIHAKGSAKHFCVALVVLHLLCPLILQNVRTGCTFVAAAEQG